MITQLGRLWTFDDWHSYGRGHFVGVRWHHRDIQHLRNEAAYQQGSAQDIAQSLVAQAMQLDSTCFESQVEEYHFTGL